MYNRNPSNKTFSNESLSNWQSKKCQFCMYRQLIYEQLERLKEAVQIKNKRIKQLEDFIKKISQMAFLNNSMQSTTSINIPVNKQLYSVKNKLIQQKQNLDHILMNQKVQKINSSLQVQKKFQDPTQISFRDINTAKFTLKNKDQSFEQINHRFHKINQLKQIKKDIERKLVESENKNKYKNYQNRNPTQKYSTQNNRSYNQDDTLRTLSQPQEEGHIGSIQNISNQSIRVSQLSQRKSKFEDNSTNSKLQSQLLQKKCSSSKRLVNSQDKSSIDIIKQYLKKLK